jgi:hypothetical protein
MAIAGHYGFPDPPGASVNAFGAAGQLWYYANLIVGRLRQLDDGEPNFPDEGYKPSK